MIRDKRFILVVAVLLCVSLLVGSVRNYKGYDLQSGVFGSSVAIPNGGLERDRSLTKPRDWKIRGIVFYGRRKFVQILDCYLRKNLASNGGYLDDIIFVVNTEDEHDKVWLEELVSQVPGYRSQPKRASSQKRMDFTGLWDDFVDPDTIYVKIDDDMLWLHEDAVPQLVHSLIDNPHAYGVAANIINNPLCSFYHYRTGAVKAFLPEASKPNPPKPMTDWRSSKLPRYRGPFEGYPYGTWDEPDPIYYQGQRMLPLRGEDWNTVMTPIADSHLDNDNAWKYWFVAAQQHMSLFANLENNTVSDYVFLNRPLNLQYGRYQVQFMAIRGGDVALHLPGSDDEHDLTVRNTKETGRPFLLTTKSLVAHFAFWKQHRLLQTDILERYRLYANENVCTIPVPQVE